MECAVVKDILNKRYLKFYIRYMDETLVLMKKYYMQLVIRFKFRNIPFLVYQDISSNKWIFVFFAIEGSARN